jgi:hypothetical protein
LNLEGDPDRAEFGVEGHNSTLAKTRPESKPKKIKN